MPEKNDGVDAGTDAQPGADGQSSLTLDEALAELAKVRQEAAARRVAGKQQEAELDEFRKWKESQMSEAERLAARLAESESSTRAAWIESAVARHGVPAELADLVTGTSRDEIDSVAKRLGSLSNPGVPPAAQPKEPTAFGGRVGAPVASKRGATDASALDDALRKALRGSR